MRKWYVLLANNNQHGPLTEDEVRALAREGTITAQSNAWCDGMDDWKQLDQIKTFQDLGAGESWEAIRSTFSRGKKGAIRTMQAAKLKIQLGKLRRTRERLVTDLGETVYAQRDNLSFDEFLKTKANEIEECENEMKALEAKLEKLGEAEAENQNT